MLRIRGGTVYDPANGVDGVVKDVVLDGGRVVADGEVGRVIDATGLVVFPGGVDVHTHVAGAGLNFARSMLPEDQRRATPFPRTATRRAGLGGPTPTSFATGYLYAGMGWTTVNEAAVPALSARRTHDELHDTPIIDKTCCVLMGNNELVLDLLERGEVERAKEVVAWYLWAAKGYGIKVVNAGGVAAWKWGKDAKKLSDVVEGYQSLTPGKIIAGLAQIIDELKLPHAMHLHCNNLGAPGNVGTTLETIDTLDGRRAHLAHLQYHAYGGDDWESIRSEAPAVAEYFNRHRNLTTDAGAVLFGDSVTLSADGPWQYLLYQLTGKKWGNIDVENETGCGVVPYVYREKNIVNAVQWATGLELLLLIDDPWRVSLTTDHPNGASFWRYPEILQLLTDASFRREEFAKLPEKAKARTCLAELNREYNLFEIAIITSAGPARTLGLPNKGHLGVGADADVAIYHRHKDAAVMFAHPRYVIKGGEIVVEDGDVRATPAGRGFVTKPGYDPAVEAYLRPRFQDLYTVSFDNYPVELARIPRPVVGEV